jgi:hypothetical protein
MKNVGKNRWGNFCFQLKGEVTSGFSNDSSADDFYVDGKHADRSQFLKASTGEKFGGKAYTLKPEFPTGGWNELLIKNWKPIRCYFYKKPQHDQEWDENEIARFKQFQEILKEKNIPYEWVDAK